MQSLVAICSELKIKLTQQVGFSGPAANELKNTLLRLEKGNIQTVLEQLTKVKSYGDSKFKFMCHPSLKEELLDSTTLITQDITELTGLSLSLFLSLFFFLSLSLSVHEQLEHCKSYIIHIAFVLELISTVRADWGHHVHITRGR